MKDKNGKRLLRGDWIKCYYFYPPDENKSYVAKIIDKNVFKRGRTTVNEIVTTDGIKLPANVVEKITKEKAMMWKLRN